MVESPYTGLNPFSVRDAPFFFGRASESDLISANLLASRLTVLYGPSGVGKSSILNAGVLYALNVRFSRLAPDGKPQVVGIVFRHWQGDPALELEHSLSDCLGASTEGTLIEKLYGWSTLRNGRLLIVLDQFEEYLLYHERADDGFGNLLPQVLNSPKLAVNLLISIREDSLARLDVFKGRIPHLFQTYLRLDRLLRQDAWEAIVRPIERFNQLGLAGQDLITIEPALVEAVLGDVRAGKVRIGEIGQGRVRNDATPSAERIETPYLQMVMRRLWDEERRLHSSELRLRTYQALGGAQAIVENHLGETLRALSGRERASAAAIFEHLVTPTESKIAHTSADLAKFAHLDDQRITSLLEKLSGPDRILATVVPTTDQSQEQHYQIFHDVLASAVLAWTTRYRVRDQQRRRLLKSAGIIVVLSILVALGLAVRRNQRQQQLIEALEKNERTIDKYWSIKDKFQNSSAETDQRLADLAKLEAAVRDALTKDDRTRASQLLNEASQVRSKLGDLAKRNNTLVNQADVVGKELALTQRQIEQIQGVKTVETPLTPAQGQSRALADKAKHLVVLMMEGRSFDHMFGFLKSATYDIEGLSGTESNLDSKGVPIRVTNDAAVQGDFSIDVAHDFGDVNIQLFDVDPVPTGAKPTNQGFVKDYATKVGDAKAGSVMKCMNASKIPNLTMLAKQYAICDHWFASVPGPELPNRAFVHFGTSNAHVDMSPIAYIGLSTIYELLDKSGVTAKIYSLQGNTLAFTFSQIANPRLSRRFVASYADFLDDCNRGTLPAYSFIEPRFNEWRDDITHQFFPANDQHIDNDIREGDRLIGNVYNAIRSSSVWESTILVIVYSQHGGLYDHFPPPSTVSPDGKSDPITGFEFTRLGVRVPAVIVSPYIGAGTIDHTVYDHTSVIATARKLFLGSAAATNFLTQRDRQANTFERLLTLTAPRVDRPSAVRTGQ